jgi:hypothetical protein
MCPLECMAVRGCQCDGTFALPNGVRIRFRLHPNDIHAWSSQGLSRLATYTGTWQLHAHARDIIHTHH